MGISRPAAQSSGPMLYPRGILVHGAVWFVSCFLEPFLWSGLSRDTGIALMAAPFVFGIGLPFLLAGSAVWMSPFLIPAVRRHDGVAYHLWVALGVGLALFWVSNLSAGPGDPTQPAHQRFTPAVAALLLGVLFSLVSDRWARGIQGLTKRAVERLAASVRHRP